MCINFHLIHGVRLICHQCDAVVIIRPMRRRQTCWYHAGSHARGLRHQTDGVERLINALIEGSRRVINHIPCHCLCINFNDFFCSSAKFIIVCKAYVLCHLWAQEIVKCCQARWHNQASTTTREMRGEMPPHTSCAYAEMKSSRADIIK